MDFAWNAAGSLDISGRGFSIRDGEVSIGAVASRVDLSVTRDVGRLTMDAQLVVERASCQKMFDSLPIGAVPLLEGSGLRGDFAWQAGLKFDTDRPLETSASWRMANRCRFEAIPELAAPDRFREPFTREVPGPDKEPLEVVSGPGSPDWVSLTSIARYLPSAVLTTEDGGFWQHTGFDQRAIEEAIRQNLSTREFQRGASTISMQLAKNLYLSRDKYIARKVQEALLTMLLEQEMQKEELLELYFNVIEYGPGIYGIGPAARHYFNSTPSELSIAQSFFLASLLPNPKAQHFEPSGALKPKWRAYLQQLMRIAKKRERLTEQELKEGLAEDVRFGVPNLLSNPYQVENGTSPPPDAADWIPAPEVED
jgi:Transglycosylase